MFFEPLLLGFPDYHLQGKNLARLLDIEYVEAELHQFPDGESKIRLPVDIPSTIVICRSLDSPNNKLIELIFTVKELRQKGCERIILVAPYLCYMRQDKAFEPGEVVSQRWVGKLLSSLVDEVITVDPHLHRVKKLEDIINVKRAVTLSAAPLIGNLISLQVSNPLIIGPDEESKQWIEQINELHDFDYIVGEKTRLGDKDVNVVLPPSEMEDRDVVLVDDMASTGKTLINTAQQLVETGVENLYCAITHPLFIGSAYEELLATGVKAVWSTDSVTHPSNCISLASILSEAINL